MRIDVTEREAVAVVERGNVLRGLDDRGVMFRRLPLPAPQPPGDPDHRQAQPTRSPRPPGRGALPGSIDGKVEYVEVTHRRHISLRLRNGRTVRWGSADESDDKARVLAVLLKQKAAMYDVSVPGQPTLTK